MSSLQDQSFMLTGGRGGNPRREQKKPKGGRPKKEPQAPRERPKDPVSEKAVKDKLLEIELRKDPTNPSFLGFPIDTVIESISEETSSNRYQGGYASYWKLARAAKDKTLPKEGSTDFENLRNACAEAIIYQNLRDSPLRGNAPQTTAVVFDPIRYADGLKDLLPDYAKPFAKKIIESTRGKTPDILEVSIPFTVENPSGKSLTMSPMIPNVIDPKDPNARRVKNEPFTDKTLISPIEVTLSANADNILAKVEKAQGYRNPYKNSGNIAYVPVLTLDQSSFYSIPQDERLKIVNEMQKAGGFIQVIPGLKELARLRAIDISAELVQAVDLAQKLQPKKGEPRMHPSSFIKSPENSSSWLQKSVNWFKNLTKESSPDNKADKSKPIQPIKEESAADAYQKMASALKNKSHFLEEIGVNAANSNQIDLMIASHSINKNLDYAKILKQSHTYLSLSERPAVAKVWFDKMIDNAWQIIGEENFKAPLAQKIIHDYDNKQVKDNSASNVKAEEQKSVNRSNEFDNVSDAIKENSTAFGKVGLNVLGNREHLLIAIGLVGIPSGKDPKETLRLSPEYLEAEKLGKGEDFLNGVIEKAESVVQKEKSEAELQAQEKNNQPNREYQL
jgi:hypothetical protein